MCSKLHHSIAFATSGNSFSLIFFNTCYCFNPLLLLLLPFFGGGFSNCVFILKSNEYILCFCFIAFATSGNTFVYFESLIFLNTCYCFNPLLLVLFLGGFSNCVFISKKVMNIFYVFVLFLSVTVITITKSIPKTRICQGWETFWIYQVGKRFGCIKLGNDFDVSSWGAFEEES